MLTLSLEETMKLHPTYTTKNVKKKTNKEMLIEKVGEQLFSEVVKTAEANGLGEEEIVKYAANENKSVYTDIKVQDIIEATLRSLNPNISENEVDYYLIDVF